MYNNDTIYIDKNNKDMINDIEDPISNQKNVKNNNVIDFSNKNNFKIDEFDNNASYNKDHGNDFSCKRDIHYFCLNHFIYRLKDSYYI